MFMQMGCLSGWKSIDIQETTCNLQGLALTLRNTTVSSIRPGVPLSLKSTASGSTARVCPEYYVSDISDVLIAASVNALPTDPFNPTQYQVPVSFTNWVNHGFSSAVGLKLGVASNVVLSAWPQPEQVDFQQNTSGQDSLNMTMQYLSSTGVISVVGAGTQVIEDDSDSITLPLHASTTVGDTVLLIVMSELGLAIPSGFSWDYTDRVLGNKQVLTDLQRNTQITIFRKVVTAVDVTAGQFTVSVY